MKAFLQDNFDKNYYKKFLTFNVKSSIDYFKGSWNCCPLFVKDLCNYSLIKDSYEPVEAIEFLKKYDCIGANINVFGPETEVYSHTDSDLLQSKAVTRMFIPLEPEYTFEYSGTIYRDGSIIKIDPEIFEDELIIFSPLEKHSYKNLSKVNQYFIIADFANEDNLDEAFWNNYLYLCAKHYT